MTYERQASNYLLHVESAFQSIENYENECRTRRTPRNCDPAAAVKSLEAVLPPNRHSLCQECFLWAVGVDGRRLHARFYGVGREEEEIVGHAS